MQAVTYHEGEDMLPFVTLLMLQRSSEHGTANTSAFLRKTTELDGLVAQGLIHRFHDRAAKLVG